ncbi:MAG: U32 family peptidase [Methanobrevibacter sp.]|jgi:putative protease|nr:U32 family peptidase [Candidatus Methanoflexus mossambicus]
MVELLAPAGDFKSLNAALNSGADAVYLGLSKWNMRSTSKNFSMENIEEAIKIAHDYDSKIYLTTNTILKDEDIEKIAKLLPKLNDYDLDALIISDLGLIDSVNENSLDIHISIQENITNSYTLNILKKLGVKRAILSRELSLSDIKEIAKKSPIETEIFIHGAMCMAISGRCFLSSYFHKKSANCGECLQPCRYDWNFSKLDIDSNENLTNNMHKFDGFEFNEFILEKSVDETYKSHFLSPYDLSMIEHIPELMKSKVDSFKIEGRRRSADYVSIVTETYREAIDNYMSFGKNSYKFNEKWDENLKKVFNRGYDTGFYFNSPFKTSNNNKSKYFKKDIGIVVNYYSKISVAEIKLFDDLVIGDEIIIQGNTTGSFNQILNSMKVNGKPVKIAKKGMNVTIKIDNFVRKNDNIYKLIKKNI